MVVYVTGLCQSHCFYCPVSRDRMYTDVTFANERRIEPNDIASLLEEARSMNAKGVGITGGDPLKVPERVEAYCRALKQEFGPQFHIHLYTQNTFDPAWAGRLKSAGLDEIRIHPPTNAWTRLEASPYFSLFRAALDAGLRVGCEIPAIPGREEAILALARSLDAQGVGFLNLNELEFSEANVDQLRARGFDFIDDSSNTVQGSRETAWAVVAATQRERLRITAHFCASNYKDAVQLRKRLQRHAVVGGRDFEVASEDGTLLVGVIEAAPEMLDACFETLVEEHDVPVNLLRIDRKGGRVEIAPWILEEIYPRLQDARCFIVEHYPTSNRLEVERTPLPYPEGDWDDDGESIPVPLLTN